MRSPAFLQWGGTMTLKVCGSAAFCNTFLARVLVQGPNNYRPTAPKWYYLHHFVRRVIVSCWNLLKTSEFQTFATISTSAACHLFPVRVGSGGAAAPPSFPGGSWGSRSPISKNFRPKFHQNSTNFQFCSSVFQPLRLLTILTWCQSLQLRLCKFWLVKQMLHIHHVQK